MLPPPPADAPENPPPEPTPALLELLVLPTLGLNPPNDGFPPKRPPPAALPAPIRATPGEKPPPRVAAIEAEPAPATGTVMFVWPLARRTGEPVPRPAALRTTPPATG